MIWFILVTRRFEYPLCVSSRKLRTALPLFDVTEFLWVVSRLSES